MILHYTRLSVSLTYDTFNVFGGGEIDFTEAKFTHLSVRTRMLTLFGVAGIYAREDINTGSKIISIFGGTNNRAPSNRNSHAPVVIIGGLVMFGGADIKIKRSIKEMFVDFADRTRGIQRPRPNKQGKGATPLFKKDRQLPLASGALGQV